MFLRAAGFLTLMLVWFAVFDWRAGISLSGPVLVFFLLFGGAVGYAWTHGVASGPRFGLLVGFCLSIVVMRWVDWDGLKPFLREFRSLEPRMAWDQVEERLAKYPQDNTHPTYHESVLIYRHSAQGWGGGARGVIRFRGDHIDNVSVFLE